MTFLESPVRASALFAFALSVSGSALGQDVERLVDISVPRGEPSLIAVRYENGGGGYLFSRDAGRTFALTCSTAIGAEQVGKPNVLRMLADGTSLIRARDGLYQDDGHGCGFRSVDEFAGRTVSDIAEHPKDETVSYVVTSGDAEQGIFQRKPTGVFTPIGEHEPRLAIHALKVASLPDGTLRFYESITRHPEGAMEGGAYPSFVRRSDDGGLTWREFQVQGTPAPKVVAVSLANPEHLLLLSQDETSARLFVSLNGGERLQPYLDLTSFGGITLAPDGRVWIADAGSLANPDAPKGVYLAASFEEEPTRIDDQATTCIALREAEGDLFVCRGDEIGALSPQGDTYAKLTGFAQITGFLHCPGVDEAAVCKPQLCDAYCGPMHYASAPVCKVYREPTCGPRADENTGDGADGSTGDGASADGSAGDGADGDGGSDEQSAGGKKKSDGCSVAVSGEDSPLWLGLLVLGLARLRRRLAAPRCRA